MLPLVSLSMTSRTIGPDASVIPSGTGETNAMADVLVERGEGIFALSLEVEGLGRDRIHLKKENIPYKPDANGFLIDPAFTCGARLRLV